ncbi:SH3 domain-containing kinase-binding protein 1-like [Aricia agestis]|uniref:SH3 domain-containing kinase-binding protein 1-like n=1 Tax=Aricia agestis TaxID=91739 RepID=UPI001C20AC29|nr:SH3 domain-containing kinase-binding protein 1-like [Aricia agestis]
METNANQMVSCVVNYAYDASEPDELTIRPGEIIKNVERLLEGWWRGELRGRRGMFPDNFVSVLTEPNSSTRSGGVQGRCRAVFSYQPTNPDELPLFVGDVLEVIEEVEEGWWRGRRAGRVGVFPSNFVVMLEPQPQPPPADPAPALPPKPVKEQCRVLFPYTAVNEDELTLAEGDVVTIVSKDAPDRGWWRGELRGRVGLFPDNFVQLLPPVAQEVEEKKPEKAPAAGKTMTSVYPPLNDYVKHYEKTASVKELTTSKISMHKENTVSKESSTQSTVTHTNKSESEKVAHTETAVDSTPDQLKKPPVPQKKSPTPVSTVGGLFSGLKNKMLSSSDKTEKTTVVVTSSSTTLAEDRPDGSAASRASAFDHVERNTILSDPRAGRVKAPRRRPPSQVLRDDTPQQIGLSNGHEVPTEKPPESEEIKPRAREWEKHRAPWMEELKLNQAKKTSDPRPRPPSHSGSTDRLLECGLDEKKSSHSMEMSKSTSSISNRISVIENLELNLDSKSRHSSESKKDSLPPELPATKPPTVQSPTAAGRTIMTILDDVKKPPAPAPPVSKEPTPEKSPNAKVERVVATSEKLSEVNAISKFSSSVVEKTSTLERLDKDKSTEKATSSEKMSTLERRALNKVDKSDSAEAMIAQLNTRILNLEKLIEVQNAKFAVAIEELNIRLKLETSKRMELQFEIEKLAHCVTQV